MTVTHSTLVAASSGTLSTKHVTASFTPIASTFITAGVKVFVTSGVVGTVTMSGNSITYGELGHIDSESSTCRFTLFTSMSVAPAAGSATISSRRLNSIQWDIQQWTGTISNAAGVLRQFSSLAIASTTSALVTMSASVLGDSAVYVAYTVAHGSQTDTAGAGYTIIADLKDATRGQTLATEFKIPGTVNPSMSDDGTATTHSIFAIEISASSAAAGSASRIKYGFDGTSAGAPGCFSNDRISKVIVPILIYN